MDKGNNGGVKSQGGAGAASSGGLGQGGERVGLEGERPRYDEYSNSMNRQNSATKRAADDWSSPSLKRKLFMM